MSWKVFQICVFFVVMIWAKLHDTPELDLGYAPAAYGLFCAWFLTKVLSSIVDLARRLSAPRLVPGVRQKVDDSRMIGRRSAMLVSQKPENGARLIGGRQ
ncbi:MAG: hypothetical protein KGL46_05895 [Hyphomicrobiales bacterium]|nr:hypothetical protein [Hyphomicrobiales bacterium]